ncbi:MULTISPECIES: hypothetical protein [Nocardia]|uniref:hypothetical protein n=1 Tax=Nocardia TaxID=1817 RepID=UPI00265A52EF|nr:hypothetical protein [Nocardia sp. PE-7]WKG08867.1 hypothetical protein QX204_28130 [Nocardia sp. PE-7]
MKNSTKRIDKLVTQLPIPRPWNRTKFVDNVAALRGRPITLISTADLELPVTPDSACGIWLMRDSEDVIIYEAGTSEYHIDQIVCHELGHMLLDHDRAADTSEGARAPDPLLHSAFPDLDPATVRAVLGRSDYGDRLEREAETFATLVMVAATADRPSQGLRNVLFRQQ